MRANWYGLFRKKFKDTYGHVGGPFYSVLVGLEKPNNYGVPYSLTDEFACVYRMHCLAPDQLLIRFVELLWQLSLHALREVHRRTYAADVVSNPLPASLTDVLMKVRAEVIFVALNTNMLE